MKSSGGLKNLKSRKDSCTDKGMGNKGEYKQVTSTGPTSKSTVPSRSGSVKEAQHQNLFGGKHKA